MLTPSNIHKAEGFHQKTIPWSLRLRESQGDGQQRKTLSLEQKRVIRVGCRHLNLPWGGRTVIAELGAVVAVGSVRDWNRIASRLPGRMNKDCRKRWSKISDNVKKGNWCVVVSAGR